MSETTRAALDAAIQTHIMDEYEGDQATAWVVIAETTSIGMLDYGVGSMVVEVRDMQSAYLSTGLIYSALTQEPDDD